MSYSVALPLTSSAAYSTPSIFQAQWLALETALQTEHEAFNIATSGIHTLGKAGILMEGTTAEITAISTAPGSGALAFDTTLGCWKINGAGDDDKWVDIHYALPTTRVQAYANTTTIASGTENTLVKYDTQVLDSLGEYDPATSLFTAQDAGYFLVNGVIFYAVSSTACDPTIILSGSYGAYRSVTENLLSTSLCGTIGISTIAYIPSGGTLGMLLQTSVSSAVTAYSGAGKTFLRIHRVS